MTRASCRRGVSVVEAVFALVLVTVAFLPLLGTLTGARDLARDAYALLDLVERIRDEEARDPAPMALAAPGGPPLLRREHRARSGTHEVVAVVGDLDPYSSFAPAAPREVAP